eukprot:6481738-Amphidinium_carterae.1
MLQPLGDPGKGQGGHCPRGGGGPSRSSGQELARPSPTRGGERVPARHVRVVELQQSSEAARTL